MKDPSLGLQITIKFKTKLHKNKGEGKMGKVENSSVKKKIAMYQGNWFQVSKFKGDKQIKRWSDMP